MESLSAQQYAACLTGDIPEPEEIADDLWSVPVPMPGGYLRYSLSVVSFEAAGGVGILDPGWPGAASLESLDAFLQRFDRSLGSVRTVVATHAHPDHLGLAPRLREIGGAELIWGRAEQEAMDAPEPDAVAAIDGWGAPPAVAAHLRGRIPGDGPSSPAVRADRYLDDGDRIEMGSARLRAVLTPGHTPGHLCLVDEDRRLLFSGDHVLPTVFPGIGLSHAPGPDPIADYLTSLERLALYDDFDVIPGHGYRFRGLAARRAATAEHIRRRSDEVAAVLEREPDASVWAIASRLTWTGGWDQLRDGGLLRSALSQTALYCAFVRGGSHAADARAAKVTDS